MQHIHLDAKPDNDFASVQRAEAHYTAQLRKIAKHVGELVKGSDLDDPASLQDIVTILNQYSKVLKPWAETTAKKMLADVNRRNEEAWKGYTQDLSKALRNEILHTPIGVTLQQELASQVDLITSLPRSAAERVQKLATEAVIGGKRYDDVKAAVMRTGLVTAARAETIARTETSRVGSLLTKVRAEFIGSPGYVWRNAGDVDVRPLHRSYRRGGIADKFYEWDDPPVSGENGERSLPGAIYNCRCYAEPVIPREFNN